MATPRLRVGVWGDWFLAEELAHVGHDVREIDEGVDARAFDMIVLDIPSRLFYELPHVIPEVRRGQLVLHTALEHGVQALDDWEVQGAIVMAAHRIWKDYWVASAADEVGESVVSLLISEIGGRVTLIDDDQRPALMAAQRLRAMSHEVRRDASELLISTLPGIQTDIEDFLQLHDEPGLGRKDIDTLELMHSAIDDPNAATLFAALERRYAARTGYTEGELWAMGKRPL